MYFLSIEFSFLRFVALFVLVSALLVSGWLVFTRVTEPAYYDLDRNMSMADVEAIMGRPHHVVTSCNGLESCWQYDVHHWSGNHLAELWFQQGRLVGGCAGKGRNIAE